MWRHSSLIHGKLNIILSPHSFELLPSPPLPPQYLQNSPLTIRITTRQITAYYSICFTFQVHSAQSNLSRIFSRIVRTFHLSHFHTNEMAIKRRRWLFNPFSLIKDYRLILKVCSLKRPLLLTLECLPSFFCLFVTSLLDHCTEHFLWW